MKELTGHIEVIKADIFVQIYVVVIAVAIAFTILDLITALIRVYFCDGCVITSSGIDTTLNKFITIIVYTFFSGMIFLISRHKVVLIFLYGPMLIYVFREMISILENTSSKRGKTNVIVTLLKSVYESAIALYKKKVIKLIANKLNIEDYGTRESGRSDRLSEDP